MLKARNYLWISMTLKLQNETNLILLLIFTLLCNPLSSQGLAKWGELRAYESDLIVCSFDSAANEVVLSDFANVELRTGESIKTKHHKRIKILKESGKEVANIILRGNISSIRAQTINIESGKVVKTQLKKKDFMKVESDEKLSEVRFSFPNAKVGSIIEYDYVLESGNYNSLTKWNFQNEIPTLFSQVSAQIDERFQYRISYQGLRLQEKHKEGSHNTWLLTNLPKIENESYCPYVYDYVEQVNFQLDTYYICTGKKIEHMTSLEEFAEYLLERAEFLKILKKKNKRGSNA